MFAINSGTFGATSADVFLALILAAVARRFRLTLDPALDGRPWATMTLRPQGVVPMRLEARR